MASKQDQIRNKLQTKVFSVFGKTVTLKSKSAVVYNDRGEEENQTLTSSSIEIVPYNIVHNSTSHQQFGELKAGDMDAAVPYTVDISKGDLLTIESEDWIVRELEKNYLPDNVVTIVRLSRVNQD